MTTVVLGWDGLDADLVEEFGLADEFGEYCSRLETYANDTIGKPHTREVWPTIITGLRPERHGIRAATDDDPVKWSHPALQTAADIGRTIVPDAPRSAIGRWLRSQGAEVERYGAEYYADHGLSTVFDGRRSSTIAVPNYWTGRDERMGFVFDRGAELSEWLDRDEHGWQPVGRQQQARVEERMWSEAGSKVGLIKSELQREYDLIFAWFGVVDTAGHVEPVAEEPIQRRAYEAAADWTNEIRGTLSDEDDLVCLSDHGLRDGEHTMDAVIASDNRAVVRDTPTVFEVATSLGMLAPARTGSPIPPVEENTTRATRGETGDDVRDRLEELGYVD
jgi:hypothetical protein